jgi:hypothetical protein
MNWDGEMPGIPGAIVKTVPHLPTLLPGAIQVGPHSQARPGALLRVVQGTARFLVTAGVTIEVAVEAGVDPSDVGSFLMGGVRGALIHQRGELPLHAATLVPPQGDNAVAICGPSGVGKSTLAAALVLRGWSLLADDLTRVSLRDSIVTAWPGGTGIKLMPDAVDYLGIDASQLRRVASAVEKLLLQAPAHPTPVALGCVIALHRSPSSRIEVLERSEAIAVVSAQTFRPHYISALGIAEQHLRMVLEVAGQCRCAAASGYHGVASLADAIVRFVLR